MAKRPVRQFAAAALLLFVSAAPAGAQGPQARPALPPTALVMLPAALTGVGTGGPVWCWRLCSPHSIGLHEWRHGPAQLTVIEQRLNGLAEALRVVRPEYVAFYASLDRRQKSLVDALGPNRRGWQW